MAPWRRLRAASSGKLAEGKPRGRAGFRVQVAGEYNVTISNNSYRKAGISLIGGASWTKKTARRTGGFFEAGADQAIRRSSASRYFAAVFSSTSCGRRGAGGVLSQVWVSSQSRTNCLSNEGGLMPTR